MERAIKGGFTAASVAVPRLLRATARCFISFSQVAREAMLGKWQYSALSKSLNKSANRYLMITSSTLFYTVGIFSSETVST